MAILDLNENSDSEDSEYSVQLDDSDDDTEKKENILKEQIKSFENPLSVDKLDFKKFFENNNLSDMVNKIKNSNPKDRKNIAKMMSSLNIPNNFNFKSIGEIDRLQQKNNLKNKLNEIQEKKKNDSNSNNSETKLSKSQKKRLRKKKLKMFKNSENYDENNNKIEKIEN